MRGGVFLYPADRRRGYARGRLRLVYEANPIAFLIEQAGGAATDGAGRILDLVPASLHERTPLDLRLAPSEVERVARYLEGGARHGRALAAVRPPRPAPGLRESAMSVKHPIISVTGSSGAGTTSVQNTFEQIFRRERRRRRLHRGRRLPPLRPRGRCARSMAAENRKGNANFSHFGPRRQPRRGARGRCSGTTARPAPGGRATTSTTTREAERYGAPPGTFTAWEPLPAEQRPPVLRGPARRRGDARRSTSRATPTSRSASCR